MPPAMWASINVEHWAMIKRLVLAVALTIGLAGYAVAQKEVHRHHRPSRPIFQLAPPPESLAPAAQSSSGGGGSAYWSPVGGNPIHYAQTSGFYAGR